MNKHIALFLVIFLSTSNAQAALVVGQPSTKASCDESGCNYDQLTKDQQAQYQMVISGQSGKWFWTSREGKMLVATPGGLYINYVNPEGSGSVKLQLITYDDGRQDCEYFEHIHQELSTITYWGSCEVQADK